MTVRPSPSAGRRFLVYAAPVLAYIGLIFFLSSRSHLPSPSLPGFDKLAHCGEYAVLGLLAARALTGYGIAHSRAVPLAVVFGTLFGFSDELHQLFTPGRSVEALDLLADVLGSSGGAWVWYWRRNAGVREARGIRGP